MEIPAHIVEARPKYHCVVIKEYERGWGSDTIGKHYFDNEAEAVAFETKYNSRNTSFAAPEYYTQATYVGEI